MNVKCQCCGNIIDRNVAFKVVVGKVNKYYCNENEYQMIQKVRELKDDTYEKIFECFNRKVTNSALFKEISELENIYGYKKILGYVNDNMEYLSSILIEKIFASEYAQIRYFVAILKNNLADYSLEDYIYKKNIIVDIPEIKYKERNKKRTLEEIEQEVGE